MRKLSTPVLIVDVPERCADLLYAAGFRAPDPVVFLGANGKRWLVVSPMEQGRARETARGVKVLTSRELKLRPQERRRLSGWAAGVLREAGVRVAAVGPSFPLGVARRLERAGISLRVQEEGLFPGRQVKRAGETDRIAECQRAAVAAVRRATAMIGAARAGAGGVLELDGEPLTSERVRAAMQAVLIERDCLGRDMIVAGGVQGADPHQAGAGPLRAGESIVIDVFPQHQEHGYWGDITRTVVKGRPSPKLAAMYRAVHAAQRAALARVRAGAEAGLVHAAAVEEFARRGFETRMDGGRAEGFIHSTGHGVGLEIHEAPRLGPGGGRLRAGQVVTVEPGLYYADAGGVRIEDTVCVTRTGYRLLAACPKRFML